MDSAHIIRSDDLRDQNRLRLIDTLRRHGACNPAQIREKTGLSAASVSMLSTQMIDQGILCSSKRPRDKQTSSRGRPQSQLSLNPNAGDCATLTLAIDRIHAQRINYAGQVCESYDQQLDTRDLGVSEIISVAINAIERVWTDSGTESATQPLHQIGVAFQGMTEHATGNLLWSPIIKHQNVPLSAALEKHFGVGVCVSSDSALIALALSSERHAILGDTFATILFSHGVGLGLYLDGNAFAGTRSSALELGHLSFEPDGALCRCGKKGCIEAYAADYGIERNANDNAIEDNAKGRVSTATMESLIDDAYAGRHTARQAFSKAGAAVGEGLAILFTLLDPMPVALVGRSKRGVELMRDSINQTLTRQLRTQVDIECVFISFENADPLVETGLILNSLSSVDKQFARSTTASPVHAHG